MSNGERGGERMTKDSKSFADTVSSTVDQVSANFVNIRSITELLIEKQIITRDELDERYEQLYDVESERIYNFILTKERGER